jgi:hypothetical protein
MDYVALLTMRSSVPGPDRDAALMRRATWQYPAGIELIAEYWPLADGPQVVTIFRTDDAAALMELEFEWNDVFDIDVHPAVSADDGLRLGPDIFARLQRMQPPA